MKVSVRTIEEIAELSCQHYHIDNETWQCKNPECNEKMITQKSEWDSILSAPNAAGCTIPDCPGYPENPDCENPDGMYIPDVSRERTILLGCKYEYECSRCRSGNAHQLSISSEGTIFPCGGRHSGDYVFVEEGVSSEV